MLYLQVIIANPHVDLLCKFGLTSSLINASGSACTS